MRKAASPPAWPVVGHAPAFLRDKLGFLTRCAAEYGDIVPLSIKGRTLLVNDPAAIQRVLIDNSANYDKTLRLTSPAGRRLSGNGLHTAFGAAHLRQRRMMQPAFAAHSLEPFFHVIRNRTESWLAGLGGDIDLFAETETLALSIILGATFGIDFDSNRLIQPIHDRRRYIEYFHSSLLPRTDFHPLPVVWRFHRARRILDAVAAEAMSQPDRQEGFVARYARATFADGSRMTAGQLRDEVLTLMSTGYETIGDAIGWSIHLLSRHPEAEDNVRRELAEVLDGRDPELADIPKLVYTRQVLDESMRIYPPTWLFVRMALGDDTLPGGVPVAAGTKLYLCQFVTHRDARYFPDPERFEPLRFTKAEIAKRPRFSYFPFGGGVHQCIGEHFANLEGVMVLAMLLSRFRVRTGAEPRLRPGVTLRPASPLRAHLEKAARSGRYT